MYIVLWCLNIEFGIEGSCGNEGRNGRWELRRSGRERRVFDEKDASGTCGLYLHPEA